MAFWSPWRGCHRKSEGCKFCYIHKGDKKRGVDTDKITKNTSFYAPIEKNKNNEYKMKGNQLVYLCFQTDFLIEEGDEWREECWEMIKERQDLKFLFLTKRIDRFMNCVPADWGDGYENVIVEVSVENQEMADYRLGIFKDLPIKHKYIACQPLIEKIDIEKYLEGIELVVVGGESDSNARVLDYDWVLDIRKQCVRKNVHFNFRQCGSHFIKDGKEYNLRVFQLCAQAKKADIDI